jgi:hypothetical protein
MPFPVKALLLPAEGLITLPMISETWGVGAEMTVVEKVRRMTAR